MDGLTDKVSYREYYVVRGHKNKGKRVRERFDKE